MKVIIVGKSAYCAKIDYCNTSINLPIVMAGHTIQLIRSLVALLHDNKDQVALIFPIENVDDEAIIYDIQDKVPNNVILSPYSSRKIPKSIHQSGQLELNSAIIKAGNKLGETDWILFVNSYPALLLADYALSELKLKSKGKTKVGVLLRGGDGYKWTQPDFLSNWYQDEEVGECVQKMYIMALMRTDFVATASTWLKHIVEAIGISVSEVIPSPPIALSLESSRTNKQIIVDGVTPLLGKIDPFKKWIVVAGRFHPDKCPALAIQAFSILAANSYHLIFAGAGNVKYITRLIKDTSRDIQDRIAIITVPPRLLSNLYSAADIVLHTSTPSETFTDARPSAVTSAAFHGKPVVAINGGGIEECLSKKNIKLLCVNPTKYEAKNELGVELAKRLELAFNNKLCQSIGDANAEFSRQNNVQNILYYFLSKLARSVDNADTATTERGQLI